ncbi:10529_t:CDS:10 [Acaulospora morrowiae]|uniref:Ubiquitin thioesterase OTU n=1 Tax=Acaulospora morrowiae TaxID=94023 RepID=A0A9N9ESX8_9GLOM|nr:10529_t:CDS:10 [Acaulospora morrowiae]
MRLRVRERDKVHVITNLTETSTFLELKHSIQTLTGISPLHQELKIGYPPRVCKAGDQDTLISIGIQNGEVIILSELSLSELDSQPKANTSSTKDTIVIRVENGFVILREMEDDNSCLFRAIGYILFRSIKIMLEDRVESTIFVMDPEKYSDVVLGRSRDEYCSWIAQRNSWGGAIELAIFASHYKVVFDIQEIRSIDVKSGRIDRYGQGNYGQCVYIIYSGIREYLCLKHLSSILVNQSTLFQTYLDYDSIAFTPTTEASPEFDQTIFDASDETTLTASTEIADKMKQMHKYTYTADFTLRCDQCKKGLKGDKEAVQHAKETGGYYFLLYF